MKYLLTLVFAGFLSAPAMAQEAVTLPGTDIFVDGTDIDLNEFLWKKRPLIVFADSADDPRFLQQMEFLNARLDELEARDVVILTDTDPDTQSALRTKLRPRGFMLALIVKDGTIYLRKPSPWDVREITRTIDKLPMRQQEVRERREAS
ncbi:DUF4174 domain-containing protein [Roseovarius sp. LXJ103]|uniref:DUF4174 domain-containing protein n=1 Tax=Roseovarius carneus TaxID=2853164 RepID=UPI000D61B255|nr:DUF4174 domain-containing protein [Roseovarius carneus]MBZ8118979.1 DUF4174 domain-containing protein [Roseovarius carneus]PWE35368.1 hypothetical protein DD563_04955 [Pelagicola sp. LXJ1103]